MENKETIILVFLAFFLLAVPKAFAGKAELTWNANSESDLAGYKVYWDTQPRARHGDTYSNFQDVGKVTTYSVENMADTGTTYFAVTAYDASSNESGFSAEVKKTPGDINKDTDVNMGDFLVLIQNYDESGCGNVADINVDCNVNMGDFLALIKNYDYSEQ